MPATARKQLSWVAVRFGLLYCAPACGRGCTWVEYQKARKKGAALARRLGKRWTFDVWENLGWHFRAISPCGRLKVSGGTRGYVAFLSKRGDIGGTFSGAGSSPKMAVSSCLEAAKNALHEIAKLTAGLV